MADEEEKQEGQAEEKPPKNVMGLVFAIINLVVMCGGAFVVFQQTLGYSPDKSFEKDMIEEVIKEREEKAAESVLYLMPALAINLKGTPKRQLNKLLSCALHECTPCNAMLYRTVTAPQIRRAMRLRL